MNKNTVFATLIGLLTVSAPTQAAEPPSPEHDHAEATRNPRLDQHMGPEERLRMRQDIQENADRTYPDQSQIESRRVMMRERMQERLKRADNNGDGAISRDEAEQSMPGLARHFNEIDRDGDGTISREEFKSARLKLQEMHQPRPESGQEDRHPDTATPEHPPLRHEDGDTTTHPRLHRPHDRHARKALS